jgi:Tol biopolymer transport system component
VSDRDGTERIYLANEDGSAVTPLVAGGQPAWAKDGRRIAFTAGRLEIHVIGVDGSGSRLIAAGGSEPGWSPDGRSLAFKNWRGDSDLDVVDVEGSNRRSLFTSGGLDSHAADFLGGAAHPRWSPDGQRILFYISGESPVSDVWKTMGLWTVNADGSGARQVGGPGVGRPAPNYDSPGPLSDGWMPAWSPDGSEIAFGRQLGFGREIEVVRADGSGAQVRVAGPAWNPDWTPDGRLIYTKNRDRPIGPSSRIFISDGGTERQLIPEANAPSRPTYSHWSAVWLR